MIHIRSVEVRKFKPWPDMFPFNVPILASLEKLSFESPVTFLVGENGSGKSTLMEALACAAGSIVVGSAEINRDETLLPLRELARDLRLVWTKRTRKGFFMRSEDFFGFARRMDRTKGEMHAYLKEVEQEYKDRSEFARQMASMAYNRELSDMQNRYGEGVDARSHGESYLNLFRDRFIPGGLYLLDEPEAPLSPRRQLAFLVLLKQMVDQDGQFIIATHSPIIMGYPGAVILSCDDRHIHQIEYDDLEHVTITRDFLTHPRLFQRELGLLDDDHSSS